MSLDPLCDPTQPYAVPTAILSNQDVEDWFVTPTRECATGRGGTYSQRYNLSSSDKDPKSLIPEHCSVLKAWADFLVEMQTTVSEDSIQAVVILIVNRLGTPLTVRLEGGEPIHGNEKAFPAQRSWDTRHKHHQWQSPAEEHTIPAGNHRDKTCGLGVLGIRGTGWFRGASAVWSITPDPSEPNMHQPFWFAACSLQKSPDDRLMGVAVTDDISAYTDHEDFYNQKLWKSPRSTSQYALDKGDDAMAPDANFTVSAYIAMLDPASLSVPDVARFYPLNAMNYKDRRTEQNTLQAVLVIDTEDAHGKPGVGS